MLAFSGEVGESGFSQNMCVSHQPAAAAQPREERLQCGLQARSRRGALGGCAATACLSLPLAAVPHHDPPGSSPPGTLLALTLVPAAVGCPAPTRCHLGASANHLCAFKQDFTYAIHRVTQREGQTWRKRERESESEVSSIRWFTPQVPKMAGAGPA